MTRIYEPHGPHAAAGIFFDTDKILLDLDTDYQRLTIFENANFGIVMLLDGLVMTTERDAAFYHELLVHPALTGHAEPRRVLVIGGGDGGTVTELVKYPQLDTIDMVELDAAVVEAARAHLPTHSHGLDDPRVTLTIADGAAFVEQTTKTYDIILVDGSDPIGPAAVLFSPPFLSACRRRLRPGGIFVTQSENPLYYPRTLAQLTADLARRYRWRGLYSGIVPSYPGGLWTWAWAGPGDRPVAPRRAVPPGLTVYHEGMFPDPDRNPAVVDAVLQ